MKNSELQFDSLKESRDWYFVEYSPPMAGNPFALVYLTILNDSDVADHLRITNAMEGELSRWLERYGVPLMVSAFDAKGDLISLKPSSFLMGRRNELGHADKIWGHFETKDLPPFSSDTLRVIYHDIPFRTTEEIQAAADRNLKYTKCTVWVTIALLILWLVVIPVAIAFLGLSNPVEIKFQGIAISVIGLLSFIYSLWKAIVEFMKLIGKGPEGRKEKEFSKRKWMMEHYFWHCERNPEGFQRLKIENFEQEQREQTVREAAAIQTK